MANILVIDDEKSIRNSLREILEYEGYKVDEAKNGVEGLGKLTEADFRNAKAALSDVLSQ